MKYNRLVMSNGKTIEKTLPLNENKKQLNKDIDNILNNKKKSFMRKLVRK